MTEVEAYQLRAVVPWSNWEDEVANRSCESAVLQ